MLVAAFILFNLILHVQTAFVTLPHFFEPRVCPSVSPGGSTDVAA